MHVLLIIFILATLGQLSSCTSFSKYEQPPLFRRSTKYDCERVNKKDFCVTIQFAGGRLGNQLFEVATALSIAKDNNCIAVFPMFTNSYKWSSMNTWGIDAKNYFWATYQMKTMPFFRGTDWVNTEIVATLDALKNTIPSVKNYPYRAKNTKI